MTYGNLYISKASGAGKFIFPSRGIELTGRYTVHEEVRRIFLKNAKKYILKNGSSNLYSIKVFIKT